MKQSAQISLAIVVIYAALTITATAMPYKNAQLPIDKRVNDLVGRLTLEEKVSLLSGKDGGQTKDIPRLGIPSLKVIDGPHGVGWGNKATCFPTGVSMGACWNPELMEQVGAALGRETRGAGKHVLLGPCIGIHRSPLGGRNFESFSEDPYHSGIIGIAYVKGVQSENIGTSIKHYAGNNQEHERNTISTEWDERTLREIYLPHFKMIIDEADPWTIMASYNRIRGQYACANPYLLKDILKGELGYKGFVVSDWGAVHSTIPSANAGLDLEMPGPGRYFSGDLLAAVKNGEVSEEVIDDKIRRLLRVMFLAGIFEEPDQSSKGALNTPEHAELARKLAEEAIVLLKNDNEVLPLDIEKIKTIAVLGPNGDVARVGGGGSSTVQPVAPVSPLEGLKAKCGDRAEVKFEVGCSMPHQLVPIPPDLLVPPGAKPGQHGLKAEYFNNMNLDGEPVVIRIDEQIDFNWGQGSPDPKINEDHFSARWTGKFIPRESGSCRLGMTTDDGFRLYIDGELIVESWKDQAGLTETAEVALEAGREYDIRAEYFENAGLASARLGWIASNDDPLRRATELAAKSDIAILFVGLSSQYEGEGVDRTDLEVPGEQNQLIQSVLQVNPNTIVVLINGTPLEMDEWIDDAPAIVEAWYPGQEGGHAIANVLLGDVNPSGKLPITFPKHLEDNPSYKYFPGANGIVDYKEGLLVGYRYYDTRNVEPLFPFGHGLSYTTFGYSDLDVRTEGSGDDVKITVSATLENTGDKAGAEVAQLYVRDVESSLPRPLKELKGFEKVMLRPGEKRTLTFNLGKDALAFYDPEKKAWVAEPGDFEFLIGSSSKDIRLTGKYTHK